jgi:hypothetical protein
MNQYMNHSGQPFLLENQYYALSRHRRHPEQPSYTHPPALHTQQPSTRPRSTQQPSVRPPYDRQRSTQQPSARPPYDRPRSTQQPSTRPPYDRPRSTQQPSARLRSTQQPSARLPYDRPPSAQLYTRLLSSLPLSEKSSTFLTYPYFTRPQSANLSYVRQPFDLPDKDTLSDKDKVLKKIYTIIKKSIISESDLQNIIFFINKYFNINDFTYFLIYLNEIKKYNILLHEKFILDIDFNLQLILFLFENVNITFNNLSENQIKAIINIILLAIKKNNYNIIKHIPKTLLNNIIMVDLLFTEIINLKEKKEIEKKLLELLLNKINNEFIPENMIIYIIKNHISLISLIKDKLSLIQSKELAKELVEKNGLLIGKLSDKFKKDMDIILSACANNYMSYDELSPDIQKEFYEYFTEKGIEKQKSLIRDNPLLLRFALYDIKNDHTFVKEIVEKDYRAFQFISYYLKINSTIEQVIEDNELNKYKEELKKYEIVVLNENKEVIEIKKLSEIEIEEKLKQKKEEIENFIEYARRADSAFRFNGDIYPIPIVYSPDVFSPDVF